MDCFKPVLRNIFKAAIVWRERFPGLPCYEFRIAYTSRTTTDVPLYDGEFYDIKGSNDISGNYLWPGLFQLQPFSSSGLAKSLLNKFSVATHLEIYLALYLYGRMYRYIRSENRSRTRECKGPWRTPDGPWAKSVASYDLLHLTPSTPARQRRPGRSQFRKCAGAAAGEIFKYQ